MREGEAASWHNPVEASTLVDLLQGLLAYKSPHVSEGQAVGVKDLGVIATYRQQVSCQCFALDSMGQFAREADPHTWHFPSPANPHLHPQTPLTRAATLLVYSSPLKTHASWHGL